MIFRKQKERVGVEVSATHLRVAVVSDRNGKLCCLDHHEEPLPDSLLTPRFNKGNVADSRQMQTILRNAQKRLNWKGKRVGIAIPPETTKYIVKSFPTLPEGDAQIKEMIRWSLEKTSKVDPLSLEIRWSVFPKQTGDGSSTLFIGLMSKSVVELYRRVFDRVGWSPDPLISSDLAFFNFYADAIPDEGVSAFLGVFQETLSLLVLDRGTPLFYKNLKKRLISKSDLDNIDMLLQFYMEEHPDLTINRYYLSASSPADLENTFSWTLFNAAEYELLTPKYRVAVQDDDALARWPFAPAVGAAWGMVRS